MCVSIIVLASFGDTVFQGTVCFLAELWIELVPPILIALF